MPPSRVLKVPVGHPQTTWMLDREHHGDLKFKLNVMILISYVMFFLVDDRHGTLLNP
jgi:hypothetical protein